MASNKAKRENDAKLVLRHLAEHGLSTPIDDLESVASHLGLSVSRVRRAAACIASQHKAESRSAQVAHIHEHRPVRVEFNGISGMFVAS